MPDYLVASFARSAVRLAVGEQLELLPSPASTIPVRRVVVCSRYLPPPNHAAAVGLEIRVVGKAPDIRQAADAFGAVANELLPVLSVAANAAVEPARLLAAYDVSPGVASRDWLQGTTEDLEPQFRSSRRIEVSAAGPLLAAVEGSAQKPRLDRVIGHYREAIRNWEAGQELTAVEHLQIAAETLTPVSTDRVLAEGGLDLEALAARWDFDPRSGPLRPFVASRVRLEEIYGGDNIIRRQVERASNGYEHGDITFGEARRLAQTSRDRAAHLIRRAILREAGLAPDAMKTLSATKFDPPLGVWPAQRFWLGTMTVSDESMLIASAALIRMRLRQRFKSARLNTEGKLAAQIDLHGDGSVLPPGASITVRSQFTLMPVALNAGDDPPTVTLSEPQVTRVERSHAGRSADCSPRDGPGPR